MAVHAGNGIYGGNFVRTSGDQEIIGSLTVDDITLDDNCITATTGEDLKLVTSGGGQVLVNGLPISSGGESNDLNDSLFNNDSGGLLAALTPVRSDSTGINTIDVSDEDHINNCVGVTIDAIADSSDGLVATDGRIEDVTTSIAVDKIVYISKTGGLTETAPSIGVGGFTSGDFVVKIGNVVQNQADNLKKDLIVDIDIIGQL